MVNNYIYWTNTYNLAHQMGAFKIYISSHTDGSFHGTVLWYTRKGSWSDKENLIELELKHQNFADATEEGVYTQCENWVKNHLPGKYTIEIDERKG